MSPGKPERVFGLPPRPRVGWNARRVALGWAKRSAGRNGLENKENASVGNITLGGGAGNISQGLVVTPISVRNLSPLIKGTCTDAKEFRFCRDHKLPKIEHEIEAGSSVLVIFSASTYDARGTSHPKHVNKTVSVNAVGVVLLTDPITMDNNDGDASTSPNYTSGDLGVESDHTLSSDDERGGSSTGPIILL
ncbi:hypothetical protein BJ138DRAFT_1117199 [Hygrophoropsis aurantiaca]|uniref:Uncharacterized protein n=1 Tax=Hygrophoropsis aurantiaca TaxID=72124 RepID=A0ACB8A127_9AGAM|nr:hypothetical protein BJ138DRAFT_1117199 [Hygrophoropsis aurantiaca]